MGRNIDVDADDFAKGLEEILNSVQSAGGIGATEAVKAGIRVGANEWRRDARESIGQHEYVRHGKKITSGAYAKSIRSHITDRSDTTPSGEVGSPKLAGLSHLLEFGHARIGGGRVSPVLHIANTAEVAFEAAAEAAEKALEEALE